jgi:two-component system, sensor histidine kinase and response regulator
MTDPPDLPLVLIVDDDDFNRVILAEWLRGRYRVAEAEDGPTALEIAARTPPDVVILDVMMPGMSGMQVCRALKDRTAGEYLPILLLTALGDQQSRNLGLEAGADDFLAKPIDRHELLLRVQAFERLRRQESQIRRQLVELTQLDQLKDDLVSLVAHDLRNALGGVMLLLETMEFADLATWRDANLHVLNSATAQMRETLDDMLRIKQLEDGVLRAGRRPVRLSSVLEAAADTAIPAARSRGVELVQVADPEAHFEGDAILLQRGLYNLLQNAVKYSPRGGRVELRGATTADEVTFEVLDQGPGIAEHVRDQIFEKYAGVATRREEGRRGFGLGLYLVQLVVQAHGGRAQVLSREGGGARFVLTLPRVAPRGEA